MNRKLLCLMAGAVLVGSSAWATTTWTGNVDTNWSNANNWSGEVPSLAVDGRAEIGANGIGVINLDTTTDAASVWLTSSAVQDYTISGPNTLNLTSDSGDGNNGRFALENASSYNLTIAANTLVSGAADYRIIRSNGGGLLQFNGDLTASGAILQFYNLNEVNKRLISDSEVRVAGTLTFNNTLANEFSTLLINTTGAELVVNTADDVNFFNGAKIQVNRNSEMTFNGANVLGNSTDLIFGSAVSAATVNFNADEALGRIDIVMSNAVLTLDLGADVNGLEFESNSGMAWSTGGELVITNFRSGVISFGTDDTGLSAEQLAATTAYYADGSLVTDLAIDGTGHLIPEPATIGMFVLAAGVIGVVRRMTGR